MADMESICAHLCLLTHEVWRESLPAPFSRATVRKLLRSGALAGLTLRRVPEISAEHYARAEALLSRASDVYAAVEACKEDGYHVILPQDSVWPVKLAALEAQMPMFLFAGGNLALLNRKAVAVAGSRWIEPQTAAYAERIGESLALEGYAMVCGGASGVDTHAQHAFLEAGGSLILVPAKPASVLMNQPYLREAYQNGHLLLLCDTWPQEAFSAHKALGRNHTIYALGDAALVAAARRGRGGSWRGAVDSLRAGYTPVFAVDENGRDFEGNLALFSLGAKPIDMKKPLGTQLFGEEEGIA